MNENVVTLANKIDRLARTARAQDLSLLLTQSELERVSRLAAVIDALGAGTYLIGSGPYTQGVYSIMVEEVVLGRLATPLEQPLDKPVDIFCQDVTCLTPREVSRNHAMIFRLGDAHMRYFIRDLGSTCGTYVNGERLVNEGENVGTTELSHGDVISLGPSHINTYVFALL
ncbi:MAG TPA: FHA domain-containing protein [Terriglobales bacterium]|nr:FHA domain-containing protein [Terriglobales bacterium]